MNARWLEIALGESGQHEIAGTADNPRILAYFTATSFHAPHDEVPWCSAFVNWCLLQAGIVGTRSAAAMSWLPWGSASTPEVGAIVVLKHSGSDTATGSPSGFHVGFWMGASETHVRVFGGNQGNQVKESAFPLSQYQVVACRRPSDARW